MEEEEEEVGRGEEGEEEEKEFLFCSIFVPFGFLITERDSST